MNNIKMSQQIVNQLPQGFDWKVYGELNPDLTQLGLVLEHQLIAHYIKYGQYENRKFTHETPSTAVDIPIDFNWEQYLLLNPDLIEHKITTESTAKWHYREHGIHEARKYAISTYDGLPLEFDPRLYKLYNPDLATMSDTQATSHYMKFGQKEHRLFYAGLSFDDIIQHKSAKFDQNINKNSILLINHHISLTGAPIYLYDLYDYLIEHNLFQNIYMVEPFPNNIMPTHPAKLYHYNDLEKLNSIFEYTQPLLIYSNSINFYLLNLEKFQYWTHKTILHLHETYEDFIRPIRAKPELQKRVFELPIYVVSEEIQKQFLTNHEIKNIDICPPFIPENKQKSIETKAQKKTPPIGLDSKKILIGMCGDNSIRKNPKLLLKLAQQFPQYNFMWIGGTDMETRLLALYPKEKFYIPDNFFWIPNTDNPYPYLDMLDYFMLTSLSDPCPIVVLESLLLNKKVIVITDNIHTEHNHSLLENYISIEGKTDEEICQKFKDIDINKTPNASNKNNQYIVDWYSSPRIFNQSTHNNTSTHFLILSMYSNYMKKCEADYYVNLINQFILRQSDHSYFVPILCFSGDNNGIFGNNLKHYFEDKIINLKQSGHTVFRPNKGYDIGGLIHGLKYIFEGRYLSAIDNNTKIAYLHNKSNTAWKHILHSIFYQHDIHKSETISCDTFTVQCDLSDLNRMVLRDHAEIFGDIHDKPFRYVQGTTFITNLMKLAPLYENYEIINPLLTDKYKDDKIWQNAMTDKTIFQKYLDDYANQLLNTPIDAESIHLIEDGKCKNFIQLYQEYKLKGIPDLQIEHAIERYIGYLIL